MRWFGVGDAFAPICDDTPRVAIPVGALCFHCDEPIGRLDDGFLIPHLSRDGSTERPIHIDCHVRGFIGGVNHLRGNCSCCGGTEPPDPPTMTKRQAALAAVSLWISGEERGV